MTRAGNKFIANNFFTTCAMVSQSQVYFLWVNACLATRLNNVLNMKALEGVIVKL